MPTLATEPPTPVEVEEVEEVLPLGWKEYRTPEGMVYYYNEKTQMSSWMKPKASTTRRKVGSRSWREEQCVECTYILNVSILERSEGLGGYSCAVHTSKELSIY